MCIFCSKSESPINFYDIWIFGKVSLFLGEVIYISSFFLILDFVVVEILEYDQFKQVKKL